MDDNHKNVISDEASKGKSSAAEETIEDATSSEAEKEVVEASTCNEKKTGKTKKRSVTPNKGAATKQNATGEPQVKKPRCTPERAKKVRDAILTEMVSCYQMGTKEVPLKDVAEAVGYKNPRSDAIKAGVKLLVSEDLVGKVNGICKLTDAAVKEHVPEEKVPANPEAAMEKFRKQASARLASDKEYNQKATEQFEKVWNLLQDGKSHHKNELLEVTSYSSPRSKPFQAIKRSLKDFTEEEGDTVKFSDKVFPFGRP